MSKDYFYRDGPLVDGVPSRQQYQIAEMSDIPVPTQVTGPFVRSVNNTGWWQGWSPVINSNQGNQTLIDWRSLGSVTTSNILSDININVDIGNHYLRVRRAIAYIWIDWRLLVNSNVVVTVPNEKYRYLDNRNDTSPNVVPPIPINIESWGGFNYTRNNIPANATVGIEVRVRWRIVGAQSNAYVRYIGGLRSNFSIFEQPKTIVTDLT